MNQIKYIWRTETGILLDSIILEDTPTKLFFSKDGYTLVYYKYSLDDYSFSNGMSDISILNINKRSVVHSDSFSIIKAMNYQYYTGGMVDDNFNYSLLDYDSKSKLLTVASDFQYYIATARPTDNNWYSQALKGKFDVKKDTLILIKNLGDESYSKKYISIGKIYIDMVEFEDKIYMSCFEWERTQSNSGGGSHHNNIKRFYLSYTNSDSIMLNNILSSNYNKGDSWYPYQDPRYWLTGKDVAYSKLFLNDSMNLLLVKYGEIYYYINTQTNTVFDSLTIRKPFTHEGVTSKFDYLISLDSNKLLFYHIQSKALVDSVELPYQINNFSITPNTDKIIAYNSDGNMFIIFDSLFSSVKQKNNNEQKLNVYPNPSHESLYLEWDDGKVQAEKITIYNLLGEEVYQNSNADFTTGYLNLDLSMLYKGSYYIVVTGKKSNLFSNFFVTEY